jgi:hypothetical protein
VAFHRNLSVKIGNAGATDNKQSLPFSQLTDALQVLDYDAYVESYLFSHSVTPRNHSSNRRAGGIVKPDERATKRSWAHHSIPIIANDLDFCGYGASVCGSCNETPTTLRRMTSAIDMVFGNDCALVTDVFATDTTFTNH